MSDGKYNEAFTLIALKFTPKREINAIFYKDLNLYNTHTHAWKKKLLCT